MTNAVDYVTMREEWLMNAVEGMRATFEARTGLTIPTVRIGVGFLTGGVRSSAGRGPRAPHRRQGGGDGPRGAALEAHGPRAFP